MVEKRSHAEVLVLVSAADSLPLREGNVHPTGVFLGELVEPCEALVEAGHRLHFVSPRGKPATMDPNSFRTMFWSFSRTRLRKGKEFYDRLLEWSRSQGIYRPGRAQRVPADSVVPALRAHRRPPALAPVLAPRPEHTAPEQLRLFG